MLFGFRRNLMIFVFPLLFLLKLVLSIDSLYPITDSFSTALPIVKIDLLDQRLDRNERIIANLQVIWNDQPPNRIFDVPSGLRGYSGKIKIRWRGKHSFNWTMKPYNFLTIDSNEDNVDVSLMAFPPGNEFNLKAPGPREYARSLYFIRDAVGFQLARDSGRWAPHTQFCDLFINFTSHDNLQTQYQGVYLMEETVKRGKNRIPIDKSDPSDPNRGWILNRGGTVGKHTMIKPFGCVGGPILIEYPKDAALNNRFEFISTDFSRICQTTHGWEKIVDSNSFIDLFLLLQLMKADDTFRSNAFFWKNTNGPIVAGPIWDLDIGIPVTHESSGWLMKYNETSEWVNLFLKFDNWKYQLRERWFDLRQDEWKTTVVLNHVKRIKLDIGDQLEMELCDKVEARFLEIENWLSARLQWMDAHMSKCCPAGPGVV